MADAQLPTAAATTTTGCYVCDSNVAANSDNEQAQANVKQRSRRHTKRKRTNIKLGR